MPRPLTRPQQLENTAFLKALAKTGNVRLAARAVGVAYGTLQYRRSRHPTFATRWDVALASAGARLNGKGTRRPEGRAAGPEGGHRTAGGEPVLIRLKSGRIQVRAAQPGKLTRQCEQAFLLALSSTANIRLSAAAAGASEAAFHRRRRQQPGFAREWRLALEEGYEGLELALLESTAPEAFADDAWAHNERPAMPPMTPPQALQLLYLHQKEARLLAEPAHLKRRQGEPSEAYRYRLSAMFNAGIDRDREAFRVREAAKLSGGGLTPHETPIVLPDLAQVRASRADPAKGGHSDRALFGGWRIGHLTEAQHEAAAAGREKARAATAPAVVAEPPKRKPGRQLLPGTATRGRGKS